MTDTTGGMSDLDRSARSGGHANRVTDYCLALRAGVWLLGLPVRLHVYTLPGLLQRLTPSQPPHKDLDEADADIDRTARIVRRVARLPVFRLSVFPRICLRQSLALYWILRKMGLSAEIHFGVRKEDKDMRAHCWVTVRGEPLLETAQLTGFRRLYSYPVPPVEPPLVNEAWLARQVHV
ncbi:MAG: lasso peptide biosynthesis B2 protein [Gammaproteobacteria bacterium]|nr:lasso peptide biosynthesis B2 protein [Gammaproteobacteria bacterium]